jgi:hypothetical protein
MTVDGPQLVHLPANTPVEKIIEVMERDGGVIVDKLYSTDLIKQMMDETDVHFNKLDDFEGTQP